MYISLENWAKRHDLVELDLSQVNTRCVDCKTFLVNTEKLFLMGNGDWSKQERILNAVVKTMEEYPTELSDITANGGDYWKTELGLESDKFWFGLMFRLSTFKWMTGNDLENLHTALYSLDAWYTERYDAFKLVMDLFRSPNPAVVPLASCVTQLEELFGILSLVPFNFDWMDEIYRWLNDYLVASEKLYHRSKESTYRLDHCLLRKENIYTHLSSVVNRGNLTGWGWEWCLSMQAHFKPLPLASIPTTSSPFGLY